MSQQIQRKDTYESLRAILHATGLRECASRDWFSKGTGQIGVHKWTWLATKEIESLKKHGHWEGKVPNESTIRRRANYLASKDYIDVDIPRPLDEPPLWEHLRFEILDSNPWKSMEVVEMQSGYRLRILV